MAKKSDVKTATIEKIGRVSSDSVQRGSGKSWDQWIQILNKAGASAWTHQEIVAWLKKKYKLGPWWQQGVTLGYEIHIGRRVDGRNLKGEYSIIATKSLAVGAPQAWKFLCSPQGLALWLRPLTPIKVQVKQVFETEDGVYGEIRTLKAGRRLRLSWHLSDGEKPSVVQIQLVPRGPGKSILAFQHEGLRDGRLKPQLRERWRSILEDVRTTLCQATGVAKPSKSSAQRT